MRWSDRSFASMAAGMCGLTYLVGLALYSTAFAAADLDAAGMPSIRTLAFIVENATLLGFWYFTIYVVNGLALLGLVLALGPTNGPLWQKWIAGIGLVWSALVIAAGLVAAVALSTLPQIYQLAPSEAARHWHIAVTLVEGIGGGTELLGALWILGVVCGTALSSAQRALGLVIGTAGLLTLFPALTEVAAAVFGLSFMVLFLWLSVTLWPRRARVPQPA